MTEKAKVWVGIGASAGGLEALRGFVRNLPSELSATYIVAQHMAPHHKSMLADIIGRETSMSVLDVTDNLLPKPNNIYICPPNSNLVIERNRLRLIDPSRAVAAPKPSVDVFFESLAKSKKANAIGIIMSGTGSDGSNGISAIHENGGITIAQDELSAKYASMPSAAIETGVVDLIMTPEEMGIQFSRIIAKPRNLIALKPSPTNFEGIGELYQLLLSQTKVNFTYYKTPTFQRRVERRMAAVDANDQEEYIKIARESPTEVQALYRDLLISVTSFFRDAAEFRAIETYIDRLVENKKGDTIRVWIPGVATGEEAYSLAILFIEAARKQGFSLDGKLQIFATDLDEEAIEVARRGYYTETDLAEVSADIIISYFDPGPKGFVVKKNVREKMVFSIHNVTQDPPFLKIDMISCRNLLIYFQSPLQAEVFSRFHYSLVSNGLLFIGKSEAVTASEALFRPANDEKHIFFQRSSHERRPPHDMLFQRPAGNNISTKFTDPPLQKPLENAIARFESLVSAVGPNALLIDSNLQILKSYGDVSRYVSINSGSVNTTVNSLLLNPYRQDVQFTIPNVIRNHTKSKGIVRTDPKDETLKERIMIYPLDNGIDEEVLALVVFDSWHEKQTNMGDDIPESSNAFQKIEELSNELNITKVNLQQTVEELETSNEELQALNEELQSTNEELQSTNEELETTNEELQSTNEELSTVNEELNVNSQQLNIVNINLNSILQNVSIPLLVVDKNLNITHLSQEAESYFEIQPDFALPHISRCKIPENFIELTQIINNTIDNEQSYRTEIEQSAGSVILSIVPHVSTSDEILGAIVLVLDNTELLMKTRNELQIIFDNVPAGIFARNADGSIIKANNSAKRIMQQHAEDASENNYYNLFEAETAERIRAKDQELLLSNQSELNQELEITYQSGEQIIARNSSIPGIHPSQNAPIIYSLIEDITEKYQAANELKLSQKQLEQALNASKLGLWAWDIETSKYHFSKGITDFVGLEEGALDKKDNKFEEISSNVHPDDVALIEACRQDHIQMGKPYRVVFRYQHAEGHYLHVESTGEAELDTNGNVIKFTGTLEDITERHNDYVELRGRAIQMNIAAKLSGIGYWELDKATSSIYWSNQLHRIHGSYPDTFSPTIENVLLSIHKGDREHVKRKMLSIFKYNEPFEFEARVYQQSGELRLVHSVGTPNFDQHGEVVGVLGVSKDITDDKNREEKLNLILEELSRSNEELNRFSYICSHDMKEPVRMIESLSELLLDDSFPADSEKSAGILKRINVNSTRLRTIIESLLAYSRIDAKVEFSDINLEELLLGIRDGLSLLIEEKNAVLIIDKMPIIWGAKVHFNQLFQNIISNALKFNDHIQPKIHISVLESKVGWYFTIDDNGPGIPEEFHDLAFELFGRLKRQDEVEGSGLGLSIAKKIVSQYDGDISISTSELGGAQFKIFLPFRK